VSRSGAALKRGVPADGRVQCWACDAPCAQRFECAACLEIYRDRATKAANDCARPETDCAVEPGAEASARDDATTRLQADSDAARRVGARLLLPRVVLPGALVRASAGAFVRGFPRSGPHGERARWRPPSRRAEHSKRHGPSSFGPCRQDARTHTFAGAWHALLLVN